MTILCPNLNCCPLFKTGKQTKTQKQKLKNKNPNQQPVSRIGFSFLSEILQEHVPHCLAPGTS